MSLGEGRALPSVILVHIHFLHFFPSFHTNQNKWGRYDTHYSKGPETRNIPVRVTAVQYAP